MLSVREVVQKLNLTSDAKINISKPENVLKVKIQEFIEEMLPEQRSLLDQDVMEVFKALTGQNNDDDEKEAPLKNSDDTFVPVFKGIWKSVKEKLYHEGMNKADFDNLPLTFRSQEVFHMKKKGLVIVKENGSVKLVKSDKEIVIRPKSANGTKSQEKAITGDFKDINSSNLEYQMFITEKAIEENRIELTLLENRKIFLAKQIEEENVKKALDLELQAIKSVKEVETIQEVKNFYDQDFEELERLIA